MLTRVSVTMDGRARTVLLPFARTIVTASANVLLRILVNATQGLKELNVSSANVRLIALDTVFVIRSLGTVLVTRAGWAPVAMNPCVTMNTRVVTMVRALPQTNASATASAI
jgi:hypothetical protein